MKLGLNLGYLGSLPVDQQLQLAKEAEASGYDSVWTGEAWGFDAATFLGFIAGHTDRIRIGSGILQMPARTPAMTAMTAAALDHLSGGRMILGLGSSGPQVAEGWHGQPFARQLRRTREYVEIVRMALARERVEYDGEIYTLPRPGGAGKSLKLMVAPVQERIPIYLAAIGPKNTHLAGEIADGWMPIWLAPEYVADFCEPLAEGAAIADRNLAEIEIACNVNVSIDEDLDRARDAIRPLLALYVGGMGSREQNFYNALACRYGFEDAAATVQDLYLSGRKQEAAAAIPAELIEMTALVGPRERVAERLEVYREAGIGTLIIAPMSIDPKECRTMIVDLATMAANGEAVPA